MGVGAESSTGRVGLESHGGQFALGLEQLKDAPKARREAGGQGPLLDLLKPQGSHLP